MMKEDKTEIVNSAINKIAHILYRQVYSYEIDRINKNFINYYEEYEKPGLYYSKDYLFRLIKYAYENYENKKNKWWEYFITAIEDMMKNVNLDYTKEDINTLNEAFSVLSSFIILSPAKIIYKKLFV